MSHYAQIQKRMSVNWLWRENISSTFYKIMQQKSWGGDLNYFQKNFTLNLNILSYCTYSFLIIGPCNKSIVPKCYVETPLLFHISDKKSKISSSRSPHKMKWKDSILHESWRRLVSEVDVESTCWGSWGVHLLLWLRFSLLPLGYFFSLFHWRVSVLRSHGHLFPPCWWVLSSCPLRWTLRALHHSIGGNTGRELSSIVLYCWSWGPQSPTFTEITTGNKWHLDICKVITLKGFHPCLLLDKPG